MDYPHGLFSWADISLPDPAEGSSFYRALFGWEAADQTDPDGHYIYTMFSMGGKTTAGLGPQPPQLAGRGVPPMWNSYITVDNLDATLERWVAADGMVMMPAMDVMDTGRMAYVADPEGAVCALWQAGSHVGAEVFNRPGALTWNELNTRDAATAREFYGTVLGWEFERFGKDEPPYWLITLPNKPQGDPLSEDVYNGGMLTIADSWPADMPAHWSVYFHVADADAAASRVNELGGRVIVPPFDTSGGRIAVVTDPQGGTFSVMSPPQQS